MPGSRVPPLAMACPILYQLGDRYWAMWGLPVQRRARQAARRKCLPCSNCQQRVPPPAQCYSRCVRHQAAAGQACQCGLLPCNLLQPQEKVCPHLLLDDA